MAELWLGWGFDNIYWKYFCTNKLQDISIAKYCQAQPSPSLPGLSSFISKTRVSSKVWLFNPFQFKDSEFDRFEKLDSCAASVGVWLGGWVGWLEKLKIKLSSTKLNLKLKLSLAIWRVGGNSWTGFWYCFCKGQRVSLLFLQRSKGVWRSQNSLHFNFFLN